MRVPPIAIYLKKSHGVMSDSFGERGAFSIISRSGGLKPRAVAGRPSVTKFTQSSCTGMSDSGKPRAAVKKIQTTFCINIQFLIKKSKIIPQKLDYAFFYNFLYNYFSDVGRNKISNKLLHIIVNSATFLDSSNNTRKVVISKHHF